MSTITMDGLQFSLESFYILSSSILVMWLASGMTLLEAGMIRARNVNDILLKNITVFAVTCVVYLLFSYHMMFGPRSGGGLFLPNLNLLSARNAFPQVLHSKEFTYAIGVFFQVMLAVVTVSIVSGATAERLRLWPFVFFSILLIGLIYPVTGYWVWGNGFLKHVHFIDVAGAGVVHLTGAIAALTGVILMGHRQGKYDVLKRSVPMPGSNMPIAAAGLLMIWIGFFGFNGGSLVNFSGGDFSSNIGSIFINTLAAGSAGLVTAMIISQLFYGTVDLTFVFNGAVVGLVSISASPITPAIGDAMLIAMVACIVMMLILFILERCKIDDPVGAIAVHGVGGIVSIIAVVFTQDYDFLSKAYGQPWTWYQQLWVQLLGVMMIVLWVTIASFLAWLLIRVIMGLRIKPSDEFKGLDVTGCGMVAYPEFTASGWEK